MTYNRNYMYRFPNYNEISCFRRYSEPRLFTNIIQFSRHVENALHLESLSINLKLFEL